MTTHERIPAQLEASSVHPAVPQRSLLTHLLRPFAARANVFVCDDASATRVVIHKNGALDVEVVIATTTKQWSAAVHDSITGAELAKAAADFTGATAIAVFAELDELLATLVDASVRVAPHAKHLEVATTHGWRPLVHCA